MEKVTLYVGLNDKDTHTQKIDTLEAVKVITNIITEKCGGGTIYNAVGVYTHEDGTIITENTLKIELFDCNDKAKVAALNVHKYSRTTTKLQNTFKTLLTRHGYKINEFDGDDCMLWSCGYCSSDNKWTVKELRERGIF